VASGVRWIALVLAAIEWNERAGWKQLSVKGYRDAGSWSYTMQADTRRPVIDPFIADR
jgi:hypothetical protein